MSRGLEAMADCLIRVEGMDCVLSDRVGDLLHAQSISLAHLMLMDFDAAVLNVYPSERELTPERSD